jgi:two-component system cell cycle sensor histidine kinase/response regulator CckA
MKRTVLLVEDEIAVANMLMASMEMWGWKALHATNCQDAVALARSHRHEIGVLLSDVLLPERCGPAVATAIRDICPGLRTVFTSGYTMDLLVERGHFTADLLRDPTVSYIQKPFLPHELRSVIERVFETMDEATGKKSQGKVLHARAS